MSVKQRILTKPMVSVVTECAPINCITSIPASFATKGLCDTPGFTSLNLPELEKEQVRFYFNEFDEYEGTCRFNGCVHINEPDCAVKMAVEKGVISRRRYTSYVELYEEIKNQKKY